MPLEEDMMKERGCQKYKCMYYDKKVLDKGVRYKNFRSKMQMHNLSIKSWDLSGLRERKKWREGRCWYLCTV